MSGAIRRDAGIAKLTKGAGASAVEEVLSVIQGIAVGHCFSSEDIRPLCWRATFAHQNAWGAAFRIAAKKGLIEHAVYRKAVREKSNARIISNWRRI
jgi:hypothetical protein